MSAEWGRTVFQLSCRCADILFTLTGKHRQSTVTSRSFRIAALYPGNRQTQKPLGQSLQSETRAAVQATLSGHFNFRVACISNCTRAAAVNWPGLLYSLPLHSAPTLLYGSCRCLSLSNFNSSRISIQILPGHVRRCKCDCVRCG